MRNRPRRTFAAPFILTIAAAVPGCTRPDPATSTIRTENPPPPDVVTPEGDPYQTWTVQSSGGEMCDAYLDVDCPPPEEATCNPPPPAVVACPGGFAEGQQIRVLQLEEGGPCYSEAMDCAEGGCDRQPSACPSWDTGTDM
jgi:hypothetical protein